MSGILFVLFIGTGLSVLYAMGRRDHRREAARRAHMLDRLAATLPESRLAVQRDGFPVLTGRLADSRKVEIELVPDTLVVRRFRQLC